MPKCHFCSAPVDREKRHCDYCRSRVELDLHGPLKARLYAPETERICPHCDIPLDTVDLKVEGKFLIEKCKQCHGLFFDPGELEMLIEHSVSNVFHVDSDRLQQLQNEHYEAREKNFRYVKCPVCRTIMHRRIYGHKSNVMVDHCNAHGYWLDEGELRQLQEWKKAGGELQQKQWEQRQVKHLKQSESARKNVQTAPRTVSQYREFKSEPSSILDTLLSLFD